MLNHSVAHHVRQLRGMKRWNQLKLAQESTIPLPMIQDIESMRIDPVCSLVVLLCRALGCTPNELMGWDG